MDFFQGSLPPNFISFCLENQNVDEPQDQTNTTIGNPTGSSQSSVPVPVSNFTPASAISPPPFPPTRDSFNLAQQMAANSPFSTDSNVDVTAYANEVVQRMEEAQGLTETESPNPVRDETVTAQGQGAQEMNQPPELVRASTRISLDQSAARIVSLSQLESTLTVAPRSQADLLELQLATDMSHEMSGVSFLQSEGEASSSVNESHNFQEEYYNPRSRETTVMQTKQGKESVSLIVLSIMQLCLCVQGQAPKEVMNPGQRPMIRANPELLDQLHNLMRKLREPWQGEVGQP